MYHLRQLSLNNRDPNVCPSIFLAHKYRFYICGAKGWDFINQHLAFQAGSGSVPLVPRSGSAGLQPQVSGSADLQPQVEGRGSFNESLVNPSWGLEQEHSLSRPFLNDWKERVRGYLTFHTICRD